MILLQQIEPNHLNPLSEELSYVRPLCYQNFNDIARTNLRNYNIIATDVTLSLHYEIKLNTIFILIK